MSKPIELTDENLEETLSSSSVPVLVDYWAANGPASYPINDVMTITPGIVYKEFSTGDVTAVAVKTSFSF